MKVLIVSIDKGLLGQGQLGDVVERHRKYGQFCDRLDIIVLSPSGFERYKISDQVTAYPSNSYSKIKYYFDACSIGWSLFKANKYDLIVTQDPFITGLVGWRLKRKFNAKLLVNFHGDFWHNNNWLKEKWYNFILNFLQKFVLQRADALRVMSEGQKDKFIKSGIDNSKVRVISTPVDLTKYSRGYWVKTMEYRRETGKKAIGPDGLAVVHVGRDDEVKDYKTLFEAFKIVNDKISNVHFYQFGAGLSVDKVKEKYKIDLLSNFKINFHSKESSDFLIGRYLDADVVVLSSKSESFGKVLVEANACGKPVVSTATTGAREIIQDGVNGFLVPVGDYGMLADKVVYLLKNSEKAKEMGEHGREIVREKYGDNTKKIINFWQDIIKSNL